MGRTEKSEALRKLFLEKMREDGYSVDTSLKSSNSEVYRISKIGRHWIVFLKISILKPGKCFWGVNKFLFDFFTLYEKKGRNIKDEDLQGQDEAVKKIVEELRKIPGPDEKLLMILLQSFKKEPRGYVLNAKEFKKISMSFSSSAEDYKIHEQELNTHHSREFSDLDDLFEIPKDAD